MIIDSDDIAHYGTPRKSGRYPWGSGENPGNSRSFLSTVEDMRRNHGMSDAQIAKAFGISSADFRAKRSLALEEQTREKIAMAEKLRRKGMSYTAIGERMGGISESTIRGLLDPARKDRNAVLKSTSDMLKREVEKKRFLDVGAGVERHLGISKEKLDASVSRLKEEGYQVYGYNLPQVTGKHQTRLKILVGPNETYDSFLANRDKISQIVSFSEDGGKSYEIPMPPISIDSKRVKVRYAEEGGREADGNIYVRPGVKDVSLGGKRYAQVRIAVDGTHYLKGMAVYRNDLPDGVDLVFNTNKSDTGNKLDAMKKMKDDTDDPFGATISRQVKEVGPDGKEKLSSVMNIVNEEGGWDRWDKNLSSQVLSKQKPALAKQQLDITHKQYLEKFEEAMSTQNPAVRRRLLMALADDADAAAVHLKAASLPRQETKVILPISSLKDNEIYAPTFRNGESVVLIRFPHGGKFEIPELKVNNNNREGKEVVGPDAPDAVGINSKVAERLSGADFDGDTVLVIPNDRRLIETSPALEGLKGFDAQREYKGYDGMPVMSAKMKPKHMGDITNLVSDMTTKGASQSEVARGVRHSMVVIDAEKHKLDYQRSYRENGIAQLKEKYQGKHANGNLKGASTLITRATSEARVDERTPRRVKDGGPIDRETGKLMYTPTGNTYTKEVVSERTGVVTEKTVKRTEKSTKLAETDDAFTLSSGRPIEVVYATHSNKLKALANQARKETLGIVDTPWSPSAKQTYAREVASLNKKLNKALWNSPLERQAQVVATAKVRLKQETRPDLDDDQLKKLRKRELDRARAQIGARKTKIEITPEEWEAIQAGAISKSKLEQIIDNADLDHIRSHALPREKTGLSSATMNRALLMRKNGYTLSEVADQLGISVSTLKEGLYPSDD